MHDPSCCRELINQQVQALYQCNKHCRMPLQSAGTTIHKEFRPDARSRTTCSVFTVYACIDNVRVANSNDQSGLLLCTSELLARNYYFIQTHACSRVP